MTMSTPEETPQSSYGTQTGDEELPQSVQRHPTSQEVISQGLQPLHTGQEEPPQSIQRPTTSQEEPSRSPRPTQKWKEAPQGLRYDQFGPAHDSAEFFENHVPQANSSRDEMHLWLASGCFTVLDYTEEDAMQFAKLWTWSPGFTRDILVENCNIVLRLQIMGIRDERNLAKDIQRVVLKDRLTPFVSIKPCLPIFAPMPPRQADR